MNKQFLKINLKSIDKNINSYFKFILIILKKLNTFFNVINIPKKNKNLTLLKSPHVNKKAREQFKITTYKKIILIKKNKNINNILKFLFLNKPKYIKINIRRII